MNTANAFREKFSGSQKARKEKEQKKSKKEPKKIELAENQIEFYNKT